jgi:predicted pyridoxine 5'-phosphate oxidase superfamily flavin-nucleotide-binding protein
MLHEDEFPGLRPPLMELGDSVRAARFEREQMTVELNPAMIEFIGRMELAFIATSDRFGDCDASLRAGPRGFLHVIDSQHLAYPEYRGNGVMASVRNLLDNPRIGMLMVDFTDDVIGLHVNGTADIHQDYALRSLYSNLPEDPAPGRVPECWVLVHVVEAYIHCRKHIPRMVPAGGERAWGTDSAACKGGDYFGVKASRG